MLQTILREIADADQRIADLDAQCGGLSLDTHRRNVEQLRVLASDGAAALAQIDSETSEYERTKAQRARYVAASISGQETLLRRVGLSQVDGNE
jgi:uncharacterized protein YukE